MPMAILPWTGSSPHTRGALQLVYFGVVGTGIIPAYAGSTCQMPMAVLPWTDHPRIRGEHFSWVPIKVAISGSSPHTRGAQWAGWGPGSEVGIIPAYAGSTYTEWQAS